MTGRGAKTRLLVTLAWRSLLAHRSKSLLVGSLIFFGTFLVVVGTAVLNSVEDAMRASIVSSISGHLQVYDSEARDPLRLFGSGFMGSDDVGEIPTFAPVKDAIEAHPNVKAVVPMGIGLSIISEPNEIDVRLADMRAAAIEGRIEDLKQMSVRVRTMTAALFKEIENRALVTSDAEGIEGAREALKRVQTDAFWEALYADPDKELMYLDTEVAPLAADGRIFYMRYVGTDLTEFEKHFDRFNLLEGEVVPEGQRGLIFSSTFFNKALKHKVAKDMDQIEFKREQGATIADDGRLKAIAAGLPGQYQRITFQLPAERLEATEMGLAEAFPDVEGGLDALIRHLLTVDDENFDKHNALFKSLVIPYIKLYAVNVGDVVTLRSYTRGGYIKAVNVKVWGVFEFQGLEASDLAGGGSLLDLMTFRELRGAMTEAKLAELKEIRDEVGIEAVSREQAEADLFGEESEVEATSGDAEFDEFEGLDLKGQVRRLREAASETYDPDLINEGDALSGAVVLHDPLLMEETAQDILALSKDSGLRIQVIDWEEASGIVGQFVAVIRIVLYSSILIIFLVALAIINNSMLIATMERVGEIGTMRAIGGQRGFVLAMFMLETAVLGVLAGSAGGLAAAGLITFFGQFGIPAMGLDVLIFLFAGPRLFPTLGVEEVLFGLSSIVLVSVASTLYPAIVATRVQPIVAMQIKE